MICLWPSQRSLPFLCTGISRLLFMSLTLNVFLFSGSLFSAYRHVAISLILKKKNNRPFYDPIIPAGYQQNASKLLFSLDLLLPLFFEQLQLIAHVYLVRGYSSRVIDELHSAILITAVSNQPLPPSLPRAILTWLPYLYSLLLLFLPYWKLLLPTSGL